MKGSQVTDRKFKWLRKGNLWRNNRGPCERAVSVHLIISRVRLLHLPACERLGGRCHIQCPPRGRMILLHLGPDRENLKEKQPSSVTQILSQFNISMCIKISSSIFCLAKCRWKLLKYLSRISPTIY